MDAKIVWLNVKIKLGQINMAYDWTLSDLVEIEQWAEELESRWPDVGGPIADRDYLETEAIQILTISKLEYLLKSLGKIQQQREMPDIIKNSTVLEDTEKDLIMYLYCVRHTLAHNGGHYDVGFDNCTNNHLNTLRVTIPRLAHHLSPIRPSDLIRRINYIYKLILLDIAGNELTTDEKTEIEKWY